MYISDKICHAQLTPQRSGSVDPKVNTGWLPVRLTTSGMSARAERR